MADAASGKKREQPNRRLLLLCAVLTLLLGWVAGYRYHAYIEGIDHEQALVELNAADQLEIAVHVKGEVAQPNVYRFGAYARVEDAVLAAQPLPSADLDRLNLAAFLIDGSEIIVPGATAPAVDGEPLPADFLPADAGADTVMTVEAAVTDSSGGLININTASATQLQQLSGIGPVKAQAIVDYRESHGSFTTIDHIKRVSGIGDATFEKIKEQICVD